MAATTALPTAAKTTFEIIDIEPDVILPTTDTYMAYFVSNTMNKTILIVAFHFPPIATSSGMQRAPGPALRHVLVEGVDVGRNDIAERHTVQL